MVFDCYTRVKLERRWSEKNNMCAPRAVPNITRKHIKVFTMIHNPNDGSYYWIDEITGNTSVKYSCEAEARLAICDFEIEWTKRLGKIVHRSRS